MGMLAELQHPLPSRKMRQLCLNMIVRNEAANIERCLSSVADHIACWVIGDTGSTDGTQDRIRSFFNGRGIPGELHEFPFHNFEQARNTALEYAYASRLSYDYLLFCDADMELVVEEPGFCAGLIAPGYLVLQRAGSLSYWNTRLVQRGTGARYHGVTHEYLEVPGDQPRLSGIWYKDHASGSSRVDKFERDIRLLSEALRQDPSSTRYWFYLAQSYRDAGRMQEAAAAYAKRAEMGGWEEETWYARWQYARCQRALGDEAGFVGTALAAYNQRPWRAETLCDLAQYYRERGMHHASLMFSEPGLSLGLPTDILFVDHLAHTVKLKEEFSIAAFYSHDPAKRSLGHDVCDWLSLNPAVPKPSRDLARSNLFFYVEPLAGLTPVADCESSVRPINDERSALPDLSWPSVITDGFADTALSGRLENGTIVLLLHETEERDGKSFTWHRFALLGSNDKIARVSRRFFFESKGQERATGLLSNGADLVVAYLAADGIGHTVSVRQSDIKKLLLRAFPLPSVVE